MSEPEHSQETLRRLERRLGELQARLRSRADGMAATPGDPVPDAATTGMAPEATDPSDLEARLQSLRALRDELRAALAEIDEVAGPTTVTVDAGPFDDWVALERFAQTLAGLEAVAEADLRSLHGRRALIDLILAGPLDLEAALPTATVRTDAATQRLLVDL